MGRHHLVVAALAAACLAGVGAAHPEHHSGDAVTAPATPDRFLTVDGVRFRLRDEGPPDAPAIVLIHGFTFSLDSWDGWAADLSRDHRVIRFDLAGHGQSGADPHQRYDTATRVRQLGLLLDALHVWKATVAGNSFGGLVAWNFAASSPSRVDRLILVDSAAFSINGVTEKPVPVPAAMRAYLLAPSPAAVAYSAAAIFAHPERLSAARLDQMRALIARNGPALVAHLQQFTLPDPRPALATIEAPTLILWGRADKVVPVAQADQLAAAIPGSKPVS